MNKTFTTAAVALGVLATVAACKPNESSTQRATKEQENVMQSAQDAVKVPSITQYTTRETVKRWLETQNEPDQTHYVYVMLPGVGFVGYYVADAAPVNICTSMTPTKREYNVGGGTGPHPLGPAPGLDGVYYSGNSCNKWYFFDANTGAKVEMGGQMAFFVQNQPLAMDVPKLEVKVADQGE